LDSFLLAKKRDSTELKRKKGEGIKKIVFLSCPTVIIFTLSLLLKLKCWVQDYCFIPNVGHKIVATPVYISKMMDIGI